MIPRLAALLVLLGFAGSAPADPLAVIPARYLAVGWFSSSDAPLYSFLRTMPGGAPACVDQVLAKTEGYFQAQLPKVKASLFVFRGKPDRAATERCVRDVLDKIAAPHASVTPHGALTEVSTGTATFFLGWASDGSVVEARDKVDVEEALANKTHPSKELLAMIARVDRAKPMWFAGALDYGTPLLGVGSLGYFASIDVKAIQAAAKATGPTSIHAFVTLVFPKPADAKQAAAAIARAAHDKRFSAPLQSQLGKLDATVKGADLVVDLAPLFWKPELFAEMTQAITDLASH